MGFRGQRFEKCVWKRSKDIRRMCDDCDRVTKSVSRDSAAERGSRTGVEWGKVGDPQREV